MNFRLSTKKSNFYDGVHSGPSSPQRQSATENNLRHEEGLPGRHPLMGIHAVNSFVFSVVYSRSAGQ